MAGDRESLEKQLSRAQRLLEILLEQRAGYGLRAPAELELEIEEQQARVACLEAEWVSPKPGSSSQPQAGKRPQSRLVKKLEVPGGLMSPDSPFYVAREPWEERCCAEIEEPGGLVRIEAPRQMGKTSLIARIWQYARQERGYQAISISFQQFERETLQDLDRLLRGLCVLASQQLAVPAGKVREYWEDDLLGPKNTCSLYFAEELLSGVGEPVLLELDEVDRVFPFEEVAREFLLMLRGWREDGRRGKVPWTKLRIALVHSTEVYIDIPASTSPFNVGLRVELSEFSDKQVLGLAQQHDLKWTEAEVEQLMALVGGHPYLVRLALYHIALGDLTLDALQETAATDGGIYGEYLRRYLGILRQNPSLQMAFQEVLAVDGAVRLEPKATKQLCGLGLVRLEGSGVLVRYEFYRTYFREQLREQA